MKIDARLWCNLFHCILTDLFAWHQCAKSLYVERLMRKRTENQRRSYRLYRDFGVLTSPLVSFPNSTSCKRKPNGMISENYSRSDNIIKSFNWMLSCLSYLWSRFYNRFIDPFVWMFTGNRYALSMKCREDTCHSSPLHDRLFAQNNNDHPEHDYERE